MNGLVQQVVEVNITTNIKIVADVYTNPQVYRLMALQVVVDKTIKNALAVC